MGLMQMRTLIPGFVPTNSKGCHCRQKKEQYCLCDRSEETTKMLEKVKMENAEIANKRSRQMKLRGIMCKGMQMLVVYFI